MRYGRGLVKLAGVPCVIARYDQHGTQVTGETTIMSVLPPSQPLPPATGPLLRTLDYLLASCPGSRKEKVCIFMRKREEKRQEKYLHIYAKVNFSLPHSPLVRSSSFPKPTKVNVRCVPAVRGSPLAGLSPLRFPPFLGGPAHPAGPPPF